MNLYLRLLQVLWKIWRLPRKDVFEESRIAFRVLPTDCDINFHMNNWTEAGECPLLRWSPNWAIGGNRLPCRRS